MYAASCAAGDSQTLSHPIHAGTFNAGFAKMRLPSPWSNAAMGYAPDVRLDVRDYSIHLGRLGSTLRISAAHFGRYESHRVTCSDIPECSFACDPNAKLPNKLALALSGASEPAKHQSISENPRQSAAKHASASGPARHQLHL